MTDKYGKYSQQFPLAVGYRDEPIHNAVGNFGTEKEPDWREVSAYAAYPWKFAKFKQIGDGKDSIFIPIEEEPEDHSKDDPLKFWQDMQNIGNAPLNVEAEYVPGKKGHKPW